MGMPVRQLNLIRGRKQRGIAPPAPSEFASQCFLVDVIRRWLDPRWRFTHMPAGEHRNSITASRLQRTGPDLQFAGPNRKMVFLELKRCGGRLSEAQQAMREHLKGCGFTYLCTDSVEVAIEWLKQHGVLRGGFTVQ